MTVECISLDMHGSEFGHRNLVGQASVRLLDSGIIIHGIAIRADGSATPAVLMPQYRDGDGQRRQAIQLQNKKLFHEIAAAVLTEYGRRRDRDT
jgi:DNA-binding cell septation regulator SpoVG